MLFVIIMEFFICWAPLHVINTVSIIFKLLIIKQLGSIFDVRIKIHMFQTTETMDFINIFFLMKKSDTSILQGQ